MTRQIERRFVTSNVELRMSGGKRYIEGYAAVFNKRSDNLGGFTEEVKPSAFTKTLKDGADVRALYNHSPNYVLGRSKAGTLELSIDSTGLHYRALSPDTTYAKDLEVLLERGDVNQSSFAFFVVGPNGDHWEETEDRSIVRHLLEVGLVDVSPVVYPAYQDATSGLIREAAVAGLAKRCGLQAGDLCSLEALQDAIRKEPTKPNIEPRDSTHGTSVTLRDWKAELELAEQALSEIARYSEFVTPA